MLTIAQGDILTVERIPMPVLVISKDYFNRSEQVIGCPILESADADPLHIPVQTEYLHGWVCCEQLKLLDLRSRGFKKVSEIKIDEIMDITDAVQSIFDYYPYGN